MINGSEPVDVGVWWMDLGSAPTAMASQWSACLSSDERSRASRFRFQQDRLTYLAARWLLRTALAAVGKRPATDWRFALERFGKPRIDRADGLPELEFNLSHTRGFVACAVCKGAEIGIDVETLVPERASLDVATRFFSPAEVTVLRSTPRDQQAAVFFRLWTLKEAFIKATGEGLSRALDSFSFSLDPITIALAPGEAGEAAQWQFVEMQPTDRHLLSVAIRRPPGAPRLMTCRSARLGE